MTKWTPDFKRKYGRDYRKTYYQQHKDQIKKYAKMWIQNNPEKHKVYLKRYQQKNSLALYMYQVLYLEMKKEVKHG